MSHYEMMIGYFTVVAARFRDDDRGQGVAELVVLTALVLVAAASIDLVIWTKLKDGAGGIEVPTPATP